MLAHPNEQYLGLPLHCPAIASLSQLLLLELRKRPCSTEKTEVDTKLTAETYGMRQCTGTRAKETKEAGTQMSQLALSVASASRSYFRRTCSMPCPRAQAST